MPAKSLIPCPNCGYENRPSAVLCNLCKEILPGAVQKLRDEKEKKQKEKIPVERSSFYAEKDKNIRNSYIILFAMIAILALLGVSIGGAYGDPAAGGVIALIVAGAISGYSWFSASSLIMSMSGAKKIGYDDMPELFNIVEEMKIASGLPMPDVYVIDSPAPNAFATGRDPNNSAVAVTTGLIEKLNRDELQGVIAHEMGHIRNFDIRYAMLAAALLGSIALISDAFLRGGVLRRRGGGRGGGNPAMMILAIVLAIAAPISAYLLQMAVSRRREFLADASAVEFTRNPNGLASALAKITADPAPLESANRATQHLYIVNPVKNFSMKARALMSTHPATEARINALRKMGADIAS
ncbi:Heat shock protein HtpX [hydrothermal vent metagenome]|uniref:Heat shock protein HtpX n=1 Tax=hydrothermal vent metagenome TaxID=652676 RepID=A0A3B1BE99_9ZZZZ